MSSAGNEEDFGVPYPLEFFIRQTPISTQASSTTKEEWKKTVGRYAKQRINVERDQYWLDESQRPLMATIYYFPSVRMLGDIDNIVKPILDGMISIVYRDDDCIERVVVQKFEPGVEWRFEAPSPALEQAIKADKPVLYVRIDDDLAWRYAP